MRIAIICRPDVPVPPRLGYGGLQRNIYDFIYELDRRGHDTFLFASLDSDISQLNKATLLGNLPEATWANLVENRDFDKKTESEIANQAQRVSQQENEFADYIIATLPTLTVDVIFVAYDNLNLIDRLAIYHEKIIWSIRDSISSQIKQSLLQHTDLCVTAMAGHVAEENPDLNIRTIVWGINTENYDFCELPLSRSTEVPSVPLLRKWQNQKRDYAVMVAGIAPSKGQLTAIKIAQAANIPIIIAGTPQDHLTAKKTDYFNHVIKPLMSDEVVLFGNANEEQKIDLLRFAKFSLSPSGFEFPVFKEPFGRSVAESLSCGTPVIGYRYGSLPYIISEGESGFLFDTFDEAVRAVLKIDKLSRWVVRKWADSALNIKRVVDEYESIFETIKN